MSELTAEKLEESFELLNNFDIFRGVFQSI